MVNAAVPLNVKARPLIESPVSQFSRNCMRSGYLVAVTGSTWLLLGFRGCHEVYVPLIFAKYCPWLIRDGFTWIRCDRESMDMWVLFTMNYLLTSLTGQRNLMTRMLINILTLRILIITPRQSHDTPYLGPSIGKTDRPFHGLFPVIYPLNSLF